MDDALRIRLEIRDACRRNLTRYTIRAFYRIPRIEKPRILDAGCGTGEPALALMRACDGTVRAVDPDALSLERLTEKARACGMSGRLTTARASLHEQGLAGGAFDIVVAEGLLNVVGFATGLPILAGLARRGGYLLIHDELKHDAEKRNSFRNNGLDLVDAFELWEDAWGHGYYRCLEKAIGGMEDSSAFRDEMKEILEFKKKPDLFRSIYYVLGKK
ncbi:MAG: class I SAM-dependent methyltransferase [Spirochaetes bacterium]|nr:MAG: class I SAM-dependent methyltransferase [Spirochaetota bacterium]